MRHGLFSSSQSRLWCGLTITALIVGLLSAAWPVRYAHAQAWYVSTAGNNNNSCASPAEACRTIGIVIDRAAPGDVINISAGVYHENLSVAKNLSLSGAGAAVTFIDGGQVGPVVSITTEGSDVTVYLSGLTLQNGQFETGAGLHSESGNGLVTVSNSRILSNTATTGGGGIFSQGRLKLINVQIENNLNSVSQQGGGLLTSGSAELINVTVTNNTAPAGGGLANFGILTITNSYIGGNNEAAQGGGLFNYGESAKLTINNSTISGNTASGSGGGLYNEGGQVVIAGSVISGNQAGGNGGAIYTVKLGNMGGQVTLNASTVRNNSTSALGGGLYNEAQTVIDNTQLAANQAEGSGGAVYNSSQGQLIVTNSQLQDNTAASAPGGGLLNRGTATLNGVQVLNNASTSLGGGGIENSAGANLVLENSTLGDNKALNSLGGGLHNYATARLNRVTVKSNSANGGGGIYNEAAGQLTIQSSLIISNTSIASGGGGLNNQGVLTLTQSAVAYNAAPSARGGGLYNQSVAGLENVTLSDNTAQATTISGGAVYNFQGSLSLTHTTVSFNRAPAVVNEAPGAVNIVNSIVASSTVGVGGTIDSCNGVITSSGNNLDSGSTCGFGGGSINNADPQLGPLQDNGGGTLSRIVSVGSPAVDAADDGLCVDFDQRGVGRPQGSHCDIGAYEVIGYTNSTPGEIAAGQCLTSTTVVSSSYVIGSLHLGVNLTYAPRGDLRVSLISPGNRRVHVLGDTGGNGQNLDVLWDDDEAIPVGVEDHDATFPYYDYVRKPDEPLTPLFGTAVGGAWRLEICNTGTMAGTLNRWSLIIPEIKSPRINLPLMRR